MAFSQPTHPLCLRTGRRLLPFVWVVLLFRLISLRHLQATEFFEVEALLQQHCVECHGSREPEGSLVLDSYQGLLRGGESGPAIVSGKSRDSLLVRAIEGRWGKSGKNEFMPPGKRDHLKPETVAVIKSWIDAGAKPPASPTQPSNLKVPKISPKGTPTSPINALAYSPTHKLLAVARQDTVDLLIWPSRSVQSSLKGLTGRINSLVFSSDAQTLFTAVGTPGASGDIQQWEVKTSRLLRTLSAHRDSIQALALSNDGATLASAGYDDAIHLWRANNGSSTNDKPIRSIRASQGAIFGLAFRSDGQVLASASFDRTAKLFDTTTGARIETFGQALKELNTLLFSPDGNTLWTGGNDNRIRAYSIGKNAREGSNRLVASVFAHEGAILQIAVSPDGRTVASASDDRTVKLFESSDLRSRSSLELQPDWPTALVFAGNETLVVGRADGSLGSYPTTPTATPTIAPSKPELIRLTPLGITRGKRTRVHLYGTNLEAATVISLYRGQMIGALAASRDASGLYVDLTPSAEEERGPWEVSISAPTGDSARLKLWIDDLPQTRETRIPSLPIAAWGVLDTPGKSAEFTFTAKAGTTLIADLSGRSIGAAGAFTLRLFDENGQVLRSDENTTQSEDPWMAHTLTRSGLYRIRVSDATYGGSPQHFFRLSLGSFPFVTGIAPLLIPANRSSSIRLLGFNLPDSGKITLKAGAPGDVLLPKPAIHYRTRRPRKLLAIEEHLLTATERLGAPLELPIPSLVTGGFETPNDADDFQFQARSGKTYVVESQAAQLGSPADTRITVLTPEGKPIERLRLQAVRNSAITFRPATSDDTSIRLENWEEMELNNLLWCGGEVMKLFRAPEGPDSASVFYSANGRRRGWFDSSPMSHPVDEPVYIVRPLPRGQAPEPNGLPVFALYYDNDDNALRSPNLDSQLFFTAPSDGPYWIRATDSRNAGSPAHQYTLRLREASPDFKVELTDLPSSVASGSGHSFKVVAERVDGFDGDIRVDFDHVPDGWDLQSPLIIEAGHTAANGNLQARTNRLTDIQPNWSLVTGIASARIEGRFKVIRITTALKPKLQDQAPKLFVRLNPVNGAGNEVQIIPGGTTRARLSIIRNGIDGVVSFSIENLPHGVIVENLGLNGITFLSNENEREISLHCAPWVSELDRPFHALENQAGRQTSRSLQLKVRKEKSPSQ